MSLILYDLILKSISQEWLKLELSLEARALKFSTKGDYIKCCQKEDRSPLKGAWFCSRDAFLSAQLWTKCKPIFLIGG